MPELKERVFISWSAGKDCYLALLKACETGLDPGALVTFVSEKGHSMAHGLPREILTRQAQALTIPSVKVPVTWQGYEKGFQQVAGRLRQEGFTGGVFGDINLVAHRQWVENACYHAGLKSYLPLWGMAEEAVVAELLQRKAQLLIVALRSDLVKEKWLGRFLNEEFIQELKANGLSPCGENGEYHTLVTGGPLFKHRLKVNFLGCRQEKKHLFLKYS